MATSTLITYRTVTLECGNCSKEASADWGFIDGDEDPHCFSLPDGWLFAVDSQEESWRLFMFCSRECAEHATYDAKTSVS